MSDKASRGRSSRAPRTVREDAIIHFSEPVTFEYFGSLPTGRSAPEAERSARGLRRSLLFLRTVRSADLDFCIGSVRGSSWCCGRSAAGARTVREDAIIHFSEPVTFGFFGSSPTGRSAPEAGRSAQGLGRSLLFLRTVRSVDLYFCIGSVRGSSWCCGWSAERARTVRAWPVFSKSFSCPK
jgi:hypothetical protein